MAQRGPGRREDLFRQIFQLAIVNMVGLISHRERKGGKGLHILFHQIFEGVAPEQVLGSAFKLGLAVNQGYHGLTGEEDKHKERKVGGGGVL